jgi:hypothetical protein
VLPVDGGESLKADAAALGGILRSRAADVNLATHPLSLHPTAKA